MKREKAYHDSTRGLWHFLSTKKEDIRRFLEKRVPKSEPLR